MKKSGRKLRMVLNTGFSEPVFAHEANAKLKDAGWSFGGNVLNAPRWSKVTKLVRSEEHTSELQLLFGISYAVFCLKKKTDSSILEERWVHHRRQRSGTDKTCR